MDQDNNIISKWASAHVFYNMYLNKPPQESCKKDQDEYIWRQRMVSETPNGKLMIKNSFFESLIKSDKVYLAHMTYNMDEIEKNHKIFSSGGCLTGSIYCTPLTYSNGKLRMHNLGVYITEVEAPTIIRAKNGKKKPDILIFEINKQKDNNHNLIGIDYLRMGEIHYSIYKQLEYLLSYKERFELYSTIVLKMKQSLNYLSLSNELYLSNENLEPGHFLDVLVSTISYLSILGYLYFEAISEYLMLFQDNKEAKKYAEVGEMYNPTYKELMYELHPKLKSNFKLSSFQPSISTVVEYLNRSSIFINFNAEHFKNWLANRIIYLTNARLFGDINKKIDWCKFHWNFDNLDQYTKPLLGHLIHRELRNFGRYPSFYFYFDQTKALQIWNYWNHMDVKIPFNGVIPKGEIGVNPALPDLSYKIYKGQYISGDSDFKYVEPIEELNIDIEPKLVDIHNLSMHSKYNKKTKKVYL